LKYSYFYTDYISLRNIIPMVEKAKEFQKFAFIHLDLTVGLAGKEIASDFVKTLTKADGVISTRPHLLK